ncbi:class I adenylate-forming enzyme family protein [Herbaspirillum autotrophicum]|uniref:class I adenylate-forming enzyme family protein n=1 Tax=Herbaspirillum autotrophicum TaxID=180195 RepID=UPI00067D1548|nr:AMP-binding protein [Herbaspirillum autotrophicum]
MQTALLDAPTLWQLVQQRVALTPDVTMLIEDDRKWTFRQFAEAVEHAASGLHQRGIGAGTEVMWQLPTRVSTVIFSFALARLGAIQNPIIHLYGKKELSAILAQSNAPFYVVPPTVPGERDYYEIAESVRSALASPTRILTLDAGILEAEKGSLPLPPASGDLPRWVYYTSGTTSAPKGALHSDATLIAAGRVYAAALQVTPQDVGTIGFPYAHVGGTMNIAMLLASGMSAVLLERFSTDEAVPVFRRHGVTVSSGSTAHYLAFLAAQRKSPGSPIIPTLRVLSGGGAPKPPELYFEAQAELRCCIAHSYGMTEAPMIAGASPSHSDDQLAHSDGTPVTGMQVKIVLADGTLAAAGQSGELRVKGPTVCKGYTDTALNADAFDADGFFRTGDLGMRRADGHIALTGRIKDVIIRKGENISAREIEDILYEHPKIGAVAVIGLPDRDRGERVCAVVESRDPACPLTFSEMVEFFEKAGAMRQKIPEQLEIMEHMPRNETFNKILKFKLRELLSTPV